MEGAGREPIVGSERTWRELQELYGKVAVKPFDLRPELANPLPSVQTQIELHEWEYSHGIQSERGWQTIKVTSPLTWILTYASPFSFAVLRQQVLNGHQQKEPEAVRSFVLRACLMAMLFQKHSNLKDLFEGLRYRVEIRTSRDLGELPIVTISAPFNTIRPADDLVTKAAGFAGGAHFAEILDVDSVRQLRDPLRDEAVRLLREHSEEI